MSKTCPVLHCTLTVLMCILYTVAQDYGKFKHSVSKESICVNGIKYNGDNTTEICDDFSVKPTLGQFEKNARNRYDLQNLTKNTALPMPTVGTIDESMKLPRYITRVSNRNAKFPEATTIHSLPSRPTFSNIDNLKLPSVSPEANKGKFQEQTRSKIHKPTLSSFDESQKLANVNKNELSNKSFKYRQATELPPTRVTFSSFNENQKLPKVNTESLGKKETFPQSSHGSNPSNPTMKSFAKNNPIQINSGLSNKYSNNIATTNSPQTLGYFHENLKLPKINTDSSVEGSKPKKFSKSKPVYFEAQTKPTIGSFKRNLLPEMNNMFENEENFAKPQSLNSKSFGNQGMPQFSKNAMPTFAPNPISSFKQSMQSQFNNQALPKKDGMSLPQKNEETLPKFDGSMQMPQMNSEMRLPKQMPSLFDYMTTEFPQGIEANQMQDSEPQPVGPDSPFKNTKKLPKSISSFESEENQDTVGIQYNSNPDMGMRRDIVANAITTTEPPPLNPDLDANSLVTLAPAKPDNQVPSENQNQPNFGIESNLDLQNSAMVSEGVPMPDQSNVATEKWSKEMVTSDLQINRQNRLTTVAINEFATIEPKVSTSSNALVQPHVPKLSDISSQPPYAPPVADISSQPPFNPIMEGGPENIPEDPLMSYGQHKPNNEMFSGNINKNGKMKAKKKKGKKKHQTMVMDNP